MIETLTIAYFLLAALAILVVSYIRNIMQRPVEIPLWVVITYNVMAVALLILSIILPRTF